jgi:hypothetical protein
MIIKASRAAFNQLRVSARSRALNQTAAVSGYDTQLASEARDFNHPGAKLWQTQGWPPLARRPARRDRRAARIGGLIHASEHGRRGRRLPPRRSPASGSSRSSALILFELANDRRARCRVAHEFVFVKNSGRPLNWPHGRFIQIGRASWMRLPEWAT